MMRVGIDNYGLLPLRMEPMDVLKWAKKNGAEGVQFSGIEQEIRNKIDTAYLKDVRQYAESENLYLEWGGAQHIPRDMATWSKKKIFDINKKAAEEAVTLGTRLLRSCSGGLMRWYPESPTTETLIEETAEILRSQKQMLKDHNAILAIETHFEFTTHELLRIFDRCEAEPGDYVGICLDTMNLLTMLENPVQATERILPWVTSTHIKDGGIMLDSKGLVTFPTGIGSGIIDLKRIIRRLTEFRSEIPLTIEDHGGRFNLPVFDPVFLSKFPDVSTQEFSSLVNLAHLTGESQKKGKCSVTGREEWPGICEERMKTNIRNLKKIIHDCNFT